MAKTLLATLFELLDDPEHESPPVARFCVSFIFGALMLLQLLKLKVSLALNRKQRSKTACYVASRLRSHSHEVYREYMRRQAEEGKKEKGHAAEARGGEGQGKEDEKDESEELEGPGAPRNPARRCDPDSEATRHVSGRPELTLPPLPYTRTTLDTALAGTLKEAAEGYSPLLQDIQALYFTGVYTKFKDCFHREATSCPSALITVRDDNGSERRCINLASYNYLGFSVTDYHDTLMDAIDRYGTCNPFPRHQCVPALTAELERKLARFLQVEDCIVHSMGFDTNAVLISAVVRWLRQLQAPRAGKVLVISDSLNHASIVSGISETEADLLIWMHHDFDQLERYFETHAPKAGPAASAPDASGPSGGHTPAAKYSAVLLIVEGIYSMEGEILCLPQILELKRRYSFCLYVDEAHSIGAIGSEGGGVADYHGFRAKWKENPPRSRGGWESEGIDVYMGTFSKSFAAAGGYVAGSGSLISFIRASCPGYAAVPAMNALCTRQILDCLESGRLSAKAQALRENSIYFRSELAKMGVRVYGNTPDSPVVPVLLYNIVKMQFVSAEMRRRGIAVVVVGFPAVPMQFSRIRFCLSAGHTREMLDYALDHFAQVARLLCLDYEFFRGRSVVYSYFKQMFEREGRRPMRSAWRRELAGPVSAGGGRPREVVEREAGSSAARCLESSGSAAPLASLGRSDAKVSIADPAAEGAGDNIIALPGQSDVRESAGIGPEGG